MERTRNYLSGLNSSGVDLVTASIEKEISRKSCATILDVGCGCGPYWDFLVRNGKLPDTLNITVLDKNVQYSRHYSSGRNFNFITKDFFQYRSDSKFDILLFSAVFHELRQQFQISRYKNRVPTSPLTPSDVVAEIIRLATQWLSTGGLLLIGDLQYQRYWSNRILRTTFEWQKEQAPAEEDGHADPAYSFFSSLELVEGAHKTGLELIRHRTVSANTTSQGLSEPPNYALRGIETREFHLFTFCKTETPPDDTSYRFCTGTGTLGLGVTPSASSLEHIASMQDLSRQDHSKLLQATRDHLIEACKQIGATICLASQRSSIDATNSCIFHPSIQSNYLSLLKEEVGAIRIVANGVFGAQDPAAWISNFDESPSTRQLDFILKQDEWTVSCYRNFFYLPNFPEDGGDRSWQSADVVPSLFSALTGENLKTEVGSLTIAVLPYKNGFECESDFGERTREFEIFGAENETSAKTQNNERNLLVLIAGIDDRKDLLGNAKSILAVFGEDINSTEMPTLLRLSVLALYIDMLFAFSFKSDRLNATKSKWLSEEVCFIGNTNDFADSSCVAVLPAFLKERIAKIKEPSEVALSDVAAWHLIPGSNYIKSKDVTGNLMIFCDKVLPAGVCRDIREIHDFYLNVYQRFDDQGVSQFLQTKIEEHSIRARKAAIFARNFSHVTGSHVISNPLFAEKLFPDSNQLKGARDGLIRELQGFEKARKALTTHNWYDSPYQPLVNWESGLETEIDRLRNEPDLWPLKRFHQYLQGRFDFIARAVTETHDQPEPVFFISDLLDSFLEQTAFIDTFVADLGVPRDKMRFVVELPGASNDDVSATFMSVWAKGTPKTGDGPPLTHEWEFQKKGNDATSRRIEAYDFLVGLPGGTIAVHAFYSLLENIIRNSIKYQNAKQHYEITIRVESYKPSSGTNASDCKRFNISISDNYSKQKVGSDDFRGKIETILGTDLVVGQGKTETTSLGIQEMKLCAASLRADRVDPKEALKVPKTTDSEVLSYQFDLEQPVLLGLVSESEVATTAATLGFGSIVRSGTPDFFLTQNCHILVVDAAKAGELAEVLESHDQQRQLPYRILVLGKINGDGANLENWIANRRVVHVADMDFDSFIRQMLAEHSSEAQTPASDRSQPAKKLALDEQLVLTCYQTWLAGWKKHEQSKDGNRKLLPWLLCVGIDRETKQVKEAWQNSVDRFNDSKLSGDLVNTIIFATSADGRQQGQCVHKSPVERSIKWKYGTDQDRSRMLMFDNHGKCFGDIGEKSEKATNFRDSVRFYQQFGGQTPELFRLLSSPPQSEFGFAFFIYSILESCLANVAVVDERLAASLLFSKDEGGDTNTEFAKDLAAHQKAGIFPVFTFKQNDSHCTTNNTVNSTPTPAVLPSGHYKPVFQQAYDVICKNLQGGVEEGIRYCGSQVGAEAASFNMLANDGSNPVVLERDAADRKFDLIVIHEGALDILSKGGVQWEPDFVDHLYHIAPVVIRTSGRGRTTTGLPPTVPFIEFNIVSNAILTSRNKYGLVRGLLGSTGQEPEPKVR